MPSKESAEIVIDLTPDLPLAEQASFYVRNSAALPRLGSGAPERYNRASLPTPVESERNTIVNMVKTFISMNRPGWLPQR